MNTNAILKTVAHRPWPIPDAPWIMTQIWHELLFAHWPIAPHVLREHVPSILPLDTFDGQCWVGIVPFHMTAICVEALGRRKKTTNGYRYNA
jgi:uncharacterized protein YqjF (DUF2071 family)